MCKLVGVLASALSNLIVQSNPGKVIQEGYRTVIFENSLVGYFRNLSCFPLFFPLQPEVMDSQHTEDNLCYR